MASAAAADEIVENGFATLAQAKYEAAAFGTAVRFLQLRAEGRQAKR